MTRDYFPGQPFRDYDPGRQTCTPSIEGAAGHGARPSSLLTALVVVLATTAVAVTGIFGRWDRL